MARVATSGRAATSGRVAVAARSGLAISLISPNDFTDANWQKRRCSIVANATTDPFGGNQGNQIIEDNTAGNSHCILQPPGGTMIAALPVTSSFWVKAGTRSWCFVGDVANGGNPGAYFNLSTGVLGTVSANTTASITAGPSGWYRCQVAGTIPNGGVSLLMATADLVSSYNGDNVSYLYAFGAVAEQWKRVAA